MKIIGKIGCYLLAAIGTGSIIYWFRKSYKKELSAIQEQEQKIADDLKELGISKENLDNVMFSEDEDNGTPLSKAIYCGLRDNPNIDIDVVDINKCLNCGGALVHICETENNGRKYLDFLFDIPNYLTKSYKSPKIGDYIRTLSDVAVHMNDEFVKYQKPRTKLEGYFMFSCDNPDYEEGSNDQEKFLTKILKLDSDLYGDYADDRHDGLTKFYEEVILCTDDLDERLPEELEDTIVDWICQKTDLTA